MVNRANVAALIPCYREGRHIRKVAAGAQQYLDTVLVVDDGSDDATAEEARAAGAEVIVHERNAGKGAAIKTGLRALSQREGVEWILILDGDGQHLPEEIEHFLAIANDTGAELIVGNRMSDTRAMPLVRKWTNLSMSWLISRFAGQEIPDSQCGFRMFSRELAAAFVEMPSTNFEFESEMLVLASRRGVKIGAAPVTTIYGDEVSKIHPVRDTVRFFELLGRIRAGRGASGRRS